MMSIQKDCSFVSIPLRGLAIWKDQVLVRDNDKFEVSIPLRGLAIWKQEHLLEGYV